MEQNDQPSRAKNQARAAIDVDTYVGDRIRQRRGLYGLTQEQLGEKLSISYQQVQKYETGANRVSAGRLFQIAALLECDIAFFFEGFSDKPAERPVDAQTNRAAGDLLRAFNDIKSASVRASLVSLARALADQDRENQENTV